MKLSGPQAKGYFANPEKERAGLLIYGQNAMRVALKRAQVIAALIGPQGEEEMRLERIPGAALRSDPASLSDAIKARSFFPGPMVAFVEDAGDGAAEAIGRALSDWEPGDAQIIVTAKQLKASSSLRKLFEKHQNAYAVGIYDDPPSRDEIEADLKRAGVGEIGRDGMMALEALSREIDPGDFQQVTEKLGLYKLGDDTPVSPDDVAQVAPVSTEAAIDDVLNIVAEGRTAEIGPVFSRLASQGVQPVGLCIGATRHFRQLFAVVSDPGGVSSGVARLRPPVFGARRDRVERQAKRWSGRKIEEALSSLTETDLQLRSTTRAPAMALMERTLVRLSVLARK